MVRLAGTDILGKKREKDRSKRPKAASGKRRRKAETAAVETTPGGQIKMNRDFEFKQLLRAYRAGIITEETFECEMGALEGGAPAMSNGTHGVRVMGRSYGSERDAVVAEIDRFRAAESGAGKAFAEWAKQCTTDCIRSGLRMISERESYHGRIFDQRLCDLGVEGKAKVSEETGKFFDFIMDSKRSDGEKLMHFFELVKNVEPAFKQISDFSDCLKDDLETKEALKLFVEDEASTVKWMRYACAAVNMPAQAESAPKMAMQQSA
jgi:hypothetical protein